MRAIKSSTLHRKEDGSHGKKINGVSSFGGAGVVSSRGGSLG